MQSFVFSGNIDESIMTFGFKSFLEERVAKEQQDVLLCQHHDTSTGRRFCLKAISRICHKYNVSLVVDAICRVLQTGLQTDEELYQLAEHIQEFEI